MGYTPHTPADQEHMLRTIGVDAIEALYRHVPATLRDRARIDLPEGLTELAVRKRLGELATGNATRPRLEPVSRRRYLPSFHSQRRRRDGIPL